MKVSIAKAMHINVNMGPFDIALAYEVLPQLIKNKLPKELRDAFDILAAAIIAYNATIIALNTIYTAYNTAMAIIAPVGSLKAEVSIMEKAITGPVGMKVTSDQIYNTAYNTEIDIEV